MGKIKRIERREARKARRDTGVMKERFLRIGLPIILGTAIAATGGLAASGMLPATAAAIEAAGIAPVASGITSAQLDAAIAASIALL